MRAFIAVAASVLVLSSPAVAQDSRPTESLERALRSAAGMLGDIAVPAPGAFVPGDRTIDAGTTVTGPVAVTGTLTIAGTVTGDAFAYGGDVVVLQGGVVSGSAVALEGRVRLEGGDVHGDIRSIGGELDFVAPRSVASSTKDRVLLTLGWAGVALLVGIGVLVFGGRTLDVVGATIDAHFGRSFLIGVGTTLALAPILAIGLIGLALTILGILLIPFAIVAYVLAVIGVLALGFLAAVSVTGRSIGAGRHAASERGAALRGLVIGLVFIVALWLLAAIATPWPTASSVVRVIAFALTWAAATVGLGATVLTRAGTRPYAPGTPAPLRAPSASGIPAPLDAATTPDWLTPTPVSGVVAAKRPSQTAKRVAP